MTVRPALASFAVALALGVPAAAGGDGGLTLTKLS